jgi:serine/threonine protein phosphatase PrpC|eukprot:COSAG01_NODE_12187_length_1783_cov_3.023159_1_plen_329_part_00
MPKSKKRRQGTTQHVGGMRGADIGIAALQGERPTMEDAHAICVPFLTSGAKLHDLSCTRARPLQFFGVFDGHGGEAAAEFTATELPKQLKVSLASGQRAVPAAVTAHMATDVAWFRSPVCDDSGTTSVSALLETTTGRLTVANVGDSRVFVVPSSGALVPLSADHDAENKAELRRMKAAGADIDEDGYINESVQTSRSIGDYDAKFLDLDGLPHGEPTNVGHSLAVVCTPEMRTHQLEADDVALGARPAGCVLHTRPFRLRFACIYTRSCVPAKKPRKKRWGQCCAAMEWWSPQTARVSRLCRSLCCRYHQPLGMPVVGLAFWLYDVT